MINESIVIKESDVICKHCYNFATSPSHLTTIRHSLGENIEISIDREKN